jgi:hypothetical protein
MLRRLSIFTALAFITFSGVGYADGLPETFDSASHGEEAILRTTLSHLNLRDPRQDAKDHVASGDLRPVGLNGYTCSVPGSKGNSRPPKVGIRCLDGTSDFVESQEHGHLIEVARAYAIAYNEALDGLVSAEK